MKFAQKIVKSRYVILIITLLLMIPSFLGMCRTRVNYDMLTYLPEDMDTVVGQNELLKDFNKGAFTFLIFEDMPYKDVAKVKKQIEGVEHVDTVIWYDSLLDLSVPTELLPADIYNEFNGENSTMMAVFFDTSTSEDATLKGVEEIRRIGGRQCYVSGMTALVVDLKNLCEEEEALYVGIAVACALVMMMILLDNFLVPFVFLASIGAMIMLNLGTNYFFGEISYITKALAAVLQLAVTMDYSIFLWNSYNEKKKGIDDNKQAMAEAIKMTFTSVVGSSVTTIAGFIALCFMSFTLGKDLGIVMAKGVIFGVIGCVTFLPALILIFDRALAKCHHKPLITKMNRFAASVVKIFPAFIVLFALLILPFFSGYRKANDEVYYDMAECLPKDINYVVSNKKLKNDYDIASTHMILLDSKLNDRDVYVMKKELEKVDGVKYVLSKESLIGPGIPAEFVPSEITRVFESDTSELLLINSVYRPASDEVTEQLAAINTIIKNYDPSARLIGEAPCMNDMIATTGHDFNVVTIVSIVAVFLIIFLVEKSATLPIILISVIELGIFINLGIQHYLGQSMSFMTPICISTIQLGATVDYAILMTTRYKQERISGADRKTAVSTSLATSIPSIIVSGMGLFAATFGVALYSDLEVISSMCLLMARGAVISMALVIFVLPAMFMLFDGAICKTTLGMTKINQKMKTKNN